MSASASSVSRFLRTVPQFVQLMDEKRIIVTSRDVSPHWESKRDGTPNYTVVLCRGHDVRRRVAVFLRCAGYTATAHGVWWLTVVK